MSRFLYFVFLALVTVAITKTFAKYQRLAIFDQESGVERHDASIVERIEFFKEKFAFLRHKSVTLDNSVETNDKLYYLTHSDNFEEALFLIDYLSDRFGELDISHPDRIDVAVSDIGFYLQRLDENLSIVEEDLEKMGIGKVKVSQR